MTSNGRVSITLESKQDGESSVHQHKGEWFRKERSLYIRFVEELPTEDGKGAEVRTLIRYTGEELMITRRGAVSSQQQFVRGQRRSGTYQSALTTFELDTMTSVLAIHKHQPGVSAESLTSLPNELPFTLECHYELYVQDELSGKFQIRLTIQEEHQS